MMYSFALMADGRIFYRCQGICKVGCWHIGKRKWRINFFN